MNYLPLLLLLSLPLAHADDGDDAQKYPSENAGPRFFVVSGLAPRSAAQQS